MNIIQCDDKLTMVTDKMKTDGTGRANIKFTEEHWKESYKGEIYKYWNGVSGQGAKYVRPDEYDADIHKDYIGCKTREYITNNENIRLYGRDNNLYIEINKLSTSNDSLVLSSRYRTMVQAITDIMDKILEYKPRPRSGSRADGRNITEAARQTVKRKFKLYEYEYNIYITDEQAGKALFDDLKPDAAVSYENTIYLRGNDGKSGNKPNISVKMYNAAVKHHEIFSDITALYKIELTIRRQVFNKLEMDITDMTTQEECINRLRVIIIGELFKLKGGETMQAIIRQVSKDDTVLARLIRVEQAQATAERRITAIEDELKRIRRETNKNRS